MQQRFLYLWFPQLATERDQQVNMRDRNIPLALTREDHHGVFLCALNQLAQTTGLRIAMRLGDARALVPELQTYPANPDQDHAFLIKIAQAADCFSPWIALDPPSETHGDGGLWLEMTGGTHLFGGEHELLDRVSLFITPFNISLQSAMADTAPAAWAAARFAPDKTRLPEGRTSQAVKDFPLEALNLTEENLRFLNRLGIRKIEDLYHIPRANMTTRMGPEVIRSLDQLLGRQPFQLDYLKVPKFHEIQKFYADPLGDGENLRQGVFSLLDKLCRQLAARNIGLRRLGLRFVYVDGRVRFLQISTSQATHRSHHLKRLLDERLPGVDTGFGVERIHLRAFETQVIQHRQSVLQDGVDLQTHTEDFNLLWDRLALRLGKDSLKQGRHVASHLPERALSYQGQETDFNNLPSRPIRLLSPAESITVMAQENQRPTHIRWRRMDLQVRQLTGPERLTREWWVRLSDDLWDIHNGTRDYYRLDCQEGQCLWVCHTRSSDRWFVQGWFG